MKTLILFCGLFLAVSFTSINSDDKGLGRVQKIAGKEVYVLSEPVRDYDVIETLTTNLSTALMGKPDPINKQLEEVIQRGLKRVDKGKIQPFDAAVTSDGENITLIKFKD